MEQKSMLKCTTVEFYSKKFAARIHKCLIIKSGISKFIRDVDKRYPILDVN